MPNLQVTSESVQNYLKSIYQLDVDGRGANGQDIALQLGVSNPGVTKMLRHLAALALIVYTPYRPVRLTELGEKIALEVIRHHRLLELYLTQSLGFGWEQVHAEAERLEHHISEEFEDTIERLLGFPAYDPHGDPIPTRDGIMPRYTTVTLASQPDGAQLIVGRVTDENAALLLYLADRGLRPGTELQLIDREPFGGSLRVTVAGGEQRISPQAAENVFVEAVSSSATANLERQR